MRKTLHAQVEGLHATCRHQQAMLDQLMAWQERQLSLIEQQNELLLSIERVYEQRLEEEAVQSFSLDHENIELRHRIRDLEGRLAADAEGDAPAPPPF